MSQRKTSVSLALASTLMVASLSSGVLASPIANADDPLAPIISEVILYRSTTECPRLTYSTALEEAAQRYARSERREDARPLYNGTSFAFLGSGDPQNAAILSAFVRGARNSVSDCSNIDFGVGFIRHEDREVDVVTIVFGQPSRSEGTAAAPEAGPVPQPVPPVPCPAGSPTPTVPAGGTCAPGPPSTNSVTMAVSGASFGKIDVTLTNSADVDASCAYTATPVSNPLGILPTINRTVAVKAKGTATLNENSPPPLSTYRLTVSCTGNFNGKSVGLGNPGRDVSG